MAPTILDVLDNFMAPKNTALERLPGTALVELGDAVRAFAATYRAPILDTDSHPVYLGGWPSANFWAAQHGPMILSSLLYCGQVVGKDPIVDWFSTDRYRGERTMTARQGYLNDDGSPNVRGTRQFLAVVVPRLQILRPLVESEALVLFGGERFRADHESEVSNLARALMANVPIEAVVSQFRTEDLCADDRRRGAFVLAHSHEPVNAFRTHVERSIQYFAREYLLAKSVGAEYTAPWPYEAYLCEQGLGKEQNVSASQHVVRALVNTSFPMFRGLTPKLVSELREDELFASFRYDLVETYRDIPNGEAEDVRRYIAENEAAILKPKVQKATRAAERGILKRIGVELRDAFIQLSANVGVQAATGEIGGESLVHAGLSYLVERVLKPRRSRDSLTLWTKLARHQRSVREEIELTRFDQGSGASASSWPEPSEPSMSVIVTPGLLFMDQPKLDVPEVDGYAEGAYAPCPCGSGLKWRFCCRLVPGSPTPD
jgi:hypothetical protein